MTASASRRRSFAWIIDARRRPWDALLAVVLLLATIYFLWEGSDYWFFGDDWVFLTRREASVPSSILEDHDGHLVVLPALQWRLLLAVFGLQYFPYLVVVVASHIGIAIAIRVVMDRAGVAPPVAVPLIVAFVLFGTGFNNVLLPFQTTLNGSVLFGLIHLLLADHPQPSRSRDAIGLVAGFVGLLCSGVAVGMAVGVGVAVWLSRGWRAAAFHTVPLAAVYLLWRTTVDDSSREGSAVSLLLEASGRGIHAVFASLTRGDVLGWVLLLVAVAGVVVAWRGGARPRELTTVTGLAVAGGCLFVLFSYYRAEGAGVRYVEAQSRYLHVGAMAFLPALGVAVEQIRRRSALLAVVPLALVLIGLPENVDAFRGRERGLPPHVIAAVADDPRADDVPDEQILFGQRFLRMSDVRALERMGVLEPDDADDGERAYAALALSLRQGALVAATEESCSTVSSWTPVTLQAGDALRFDDSLLVRAPGTSRAFVSQYRPVFGSFLVAYDGPIDVEVAPGNAGPPRVCVYRAAPTISPGSVTVTETDGPVQARVPVRLSAALPTDVSVEWATHVGDDWPASEDDFRPASGTLVLPAGTVEAFVEIEILGDEIPEGEEVIGVSFRNPSEGVAIDPTAFGFGSITIEDDDA